MSSNSQATRLHAGLAAAAYILVLLATAAGSAALLASNDGLRDEIEMKGRLLAAMARQAAATQAQTGPATRNTGLLDVAAMSAPSETVAASGLLKLIVERVESAGGTVHSVQAEPAKDAVGDGLRKLVAQLTFDSSITGLQRLLFDLETGVPFMFVDSLSAQPATPSGPGTRAGDRLRVTLSVSSYWKQK